MFGIERATEWSDYDLTSVYTTVMSLVGHPNYEEYRRLTPIELNKLSSTYILYSYLVGKRPSHY
jgi:hypothetical protein